MKTMRTITNVVNFVVVGAVCAPTMVIVLSNPIILGAGVVAGVAGYLSARARMR